MRYFGSDNQSGVHPAVVEALLRANADHCLAYGNDPWTERAVGRFKDIFGQDTGVCFVFGGTGANVAAVSSLVRSYHAVICSSFSHLYVDECGSPETVTGCKLIPIEVENAKLTVQSIEGQLHRLGNEHAVQPRVVSITQPNEYGMLYTPREMKALCDFAHSNGLCVHVDGARITNAAARLGIGLREATRDLGVDALCFGGTKNGLMFGEAVLFFDPVLFEAARYFRKKATQLASKMRFISAQFEAFLSNDLWLQIASHANRMAARLAGAIEGIPGVAVSRPVETNMVWTCVEPAQVVSLGKHYPLALLGKKQEELRWVTSFDTTQEDIEAFVHALTEG